MGIDGDFLRLPRGDVLIINMKSLLLSYNRTLSLF